MPKDMPELEESSEHLVSNFPSLERKQPEEKKLDTNVNIPENPKEDKKNSKNSIVELMENLQPMVEEINSVGSNFLGSLANKSWDKITETFSKDESNLAQSNNLSLSPMKETRSIDSLLSTIEFDSGRQSSSTEGMESSTAESSELLSMS